MPLPGVNILSAHGFPLGNQHHLAQVYSLDAKVFACFLCHLNQMNLRAQNTCFNRKNNVCSLLLLILQKIVVFHYFLAC